MKYNDNGEYKDIYVKAFDTLPVGTEVDFDGSVVPDGWTEENNILYQSPTSSGVNTNITLNDNVNNYKYIEIYYITNARAGSQKVLSNSTSIILSEEALFDTYILTKCAVYDLSNTSLTLVSNRTYEATIQTTGINITQTNNFYITKVIGYKGRIKKTSQYIEGGASISNTYGTSQSNGYSQEYINGISNIYSSSETKVGIWYGKPLYRKVVTLTLTNGFASSSVVAQNVDHIHISNAWVVKGTNNITIPVANITANWQVRTFTNINYIQIQNNNTDYVGETAYVVVEYTKTTD